MQKRVIGLFVVFILIIFSIEFVSAASCDVRLRSTCTGANKIVMGISAATNAHGQLASQSGYPYSLCCDFGTGDTTCREGNKNKIIGLSAPTNAHAEIPSLQNYPEANNVCYENVECKDYINSCPTDYPMQTLSLSASTNAHIANATGTGSYTTKICCKSTLGGPLACSLTDAFWSLNGVDIIQPGDSVMEGTQVKLVVEGTNCNGVSVSFEVREDDEGSATNQPENKTFNDNKAVGTWAAEWVDDGFLQGDPEYYFIATVIGNPSESITSNDPMLKVTEQEDDWCIINSIYTCDDYPDELKCNSDSSLCNVAPNSAPSGVDCNDPTANCDCAWNTGTSTCEFTSTSGAVCGNNVIDAGEQCDGTDWGQFTSNSCNKFGFKEGGTLACVECKFNTANCIDGFGSCGDGTIHKGETCDGTNFGPVITGCQDFNDFTDGHLSCDGICQINTSLCTGGPGWDITKSSGMCRYSTSADDDCPDGSLTYLATWIDDESEKPSWCENRVIQCPTQIKLPFFNKYSLIATIILIAVIYYIMMILRKKKLMKGKRKTSKKKTGSRKRKGKR